jgi:hypothetical protein
MPQGNSYENKIAAGQIGWHGDSLVACLASRGTLTRQTALWLRKNGVSLHCKLARARRTEPRATDEPAPDRTHRCDFMRKFHGDGKTSGGKVTSKSTNAEGKTVQNNRNRFLSQPRTLDGAIPKTAHDSVPQNAV